MCHKTRFLAIAGHGHGFFVMNLTKGGVLSAHVGYECSLGGRRMVMHLVGFSAKGAAFGAL